VEDEFIRDVVYLDDFKVEVLLVAMASPGAMGAPFSGWNPGHLVLRQPVFMNPSS
jgi:hypothetical protein